MTTSEDERLQTELSLLESMYPDQIQHSPQAREVSYKSSAGTFTLRLPNEYLVDVLPQVLAANAGKDDVREQLKRQVNDCQAGEEILDSIILAFNEIAESRNTQEVPSVERKPDHRGVDSSQDQGKATVIVWLHHLLNTNKRKQALSPPSNSVSGLTKPGYPGVLVYSGPSRAVHEHVNELKHLNWQAFQIRLETEEEWVFGHGHGVREVEAMKDLVAEVGEARKAEFMEAMRMR